MLFTSVAGLCDVPCYVSRLRGMVGVTRGAKITPCYVARCNSRRSAVRSRRCLMLPRSAKIPDALARQRAAMFAAHARRSGAALRGARLPQTHATMLPLRVSVRRCDVPPGATRMVVRRVPRQRRRREAAAPYACRCTARCQRATRPFARNARCRRLQVLPAGAPCHASTHDCTAAQVYPRHYSVPRCRCRRQRRRVWNSHHTRKWQYGMQPPAEITACRQEVRHARYALAQPVARGVAENAARSRFTPAR